MIGYRTSRRVTSNEDTTGRYEYKTSTTNVATSAATNRLVATPRFPGASTSQPTAARSKTSPSGYELHTTAVDRLWVPAAVGTTNICHKATAAATAKIDPSRNPSRA